MFEKKEKCYYCGLKVKIEGLEFDGHPCCRSCKIRKEGVKRKEILVH